MDSLRGSCRAGGRLDLVKVVIKHLEHLPGENPSFGRDHFQDDLRPLAVFAVARFGHSELLTTLLNLPIACGQFRVNDTDTHGRTILMFSVAAVDTEMVRRLLRSGADINIQTSHGMTALMISAIEGSLTMVMMLLGAGASRDICEMYEDNAARWLQARGKRSPDFEQIMTCLEPVSYHGPFYHDAGIPSYLS